MLQCVVVAVLVRYRRRRRRRSRSRSRGRRGFFRLMRRRLCLRNHTRTLSWTAVGHTESPPRRKQRRSHHTANDPITPAGREWAWLVRTRAGAGAGAPLDGISLSMPRKNSTSGLEVICSTRNTPCIHQTHPQHSVPGADGATAGQLAHNHHPASSRAPGMAIDESKRPGKGGGVQNLANLTLLGAKSPTV